MEKRRKNQKNRRGPRWRRGGERDECKSSEIKVSCKVRKFIIPLYITAEKTVEL